MSDGKTIAGKPGHTEVTVPSGLDLAKLRLSLDEGMVVARAAKGSRLDELAKPLGARADEILGSLLAKGLLLEKGGDAALSEQVELTLERKKEILAIEAKLETTNPFELLGVGNGSSVEICKNAYYDLSMRLHPDRHYGKELGSFRARIDKIFRKLTEAQVTLTDREKRAAFEKANPVLFRAAVAPSVHDNLRADDRARRIARHPYLAKHARQAELLSRARKELDGSHPAQAILDLEQLLKLEPNNAEAKKLLVEATTKKDKLRGVAAFDEALKLASVGDMTNAVLRLTEALEKSPTLNVAVKGYEFSCREGDWKNARLFGQKWVEYEPRSSKAHLSLAEAMERVGLQKNAKREAEEALKLDPDNKAAKALVAKLRWA